MKTALCPNCNGWHELKYGDRVLSDGTKEPTTMLGYVNCENKTYLVEVAGESCYPKKPDNVVFMADYEEGGVKA
jgi:hypothetical protein